MRRILLINFPPEHRMVLGIQHTRSIYEIAETCNKRGQATLAKLRETNMVTSKWREHVSKQMEHLSLERDTNGKINNTINTKDGGDPKDISTKSPRLGMISLTPTIS